MHVHPAQVLKRIMFLHLHLLLLLCGDCRPRSSHLHLHLREGVTPWQSAGALRDEKPAESQDD